jgi:uncharacterized transporter YbjL
VNPRRLAQVNLSRIKHNQQVFAATPESTLRLGDIVMAVGPAAELDKLTLLLGQETNERMDVNTSAYPAALILKILLAQALVEILKRLL